MTRRTLTTLALLAAIVVVLMFSFRWGATRQAGGGEAFAGTDAQVVDMLDAQGAKPWFSPVFEPASGEVESGLFAAQAALGAGVLGYCLGRLHGRRATERKPVGSGDARAADER